MNILKQTENKKEKVGSYCVFVPLTRRYGVKFYACRQTRDETYKAQAFAAKHNVGPRVKGRLSLTPKQTKAFIEGRELAYQMWTPKKLYGYITERVTVGSSLKRERNRLLDRLESLGFGTNDVVGTNIGRRADGKLVCLDFDPYYTPNEAL